MTGFFSSASAELHLPSTSHFLVTQLTKAPTWHGCDLFAGIAIMSQCQPVWARDVQYLRNLELFSISCNKHPNQQTYETETRLIWGSTDAEQGLNSEMDVLLYFIEKKNRISLHPAIHTGAIKGSSLLLWSFDLYLGIHKQKLDLYCGYRTRPRIKNTAACCTRLFLSYIPHGWF